MRSLTNFVNLDVAPFKHLCKRCPWLIYRDKETKLKCLQKR